MVQSRFPIGKEHNPDSTEAGPDFIEWALLIAFVALAIAGLVNVRKITKDAGPSNPPCATEQVSTPDHPCAQQF